MRFGAWRRWELSSITPSNKASTFLQTTSSTIQFSVVQFASSFGYIGVFLFFVISGFCIHLQWAKAKANGVEPEIRFGSFWKRRIRRLYPPYIIAILLFLLLTA